LMCRLFTEPDLTVMRRLRDAFNAEGLLNPQKLLPSTKACRETFGPRPDELRPATMPIAVAEHPSSETRA